jgi:general secretion pathway protein G
LTRVDALGSLGWVDAPDLQLQQHTPSRGFTLFEIVVVLAIGGLLFALAVPALQSYIDRTRIGQAITDIGRISASIKQYSRTKGAFPDTLADVSLDTLADPWGRPYQYLNLVTLKGNGKARKDKKLNPLNSDYDLYSVGADGDSAAQLTNKVSRDDVVRARDGSFIGLASDFDP